MVHACVGRSDGTRKYGAARPSICKSPSLGRNVDNRAEISARSLKFSSSVLFGGNAARESHACASVNRRVATRFSLRFCRLSCWSTQSTETLTKRAEISPDQRLKPKTFFYLRSHHK